MKQLSLYISILSAIMATSCSKQEVQEQKGIPMSFYAEDSTEKTRALLNTEEVNQNGNVLTVYDLYITSSNEKILYMDDDTPVRYTDGNWTYSPLKYWTETGTHSFMAYLSKSGSTTLNTTNYPTVTYDDTLETLNISPWEITLDNQFDFLYAYHSRKMNGLQDAHRPVAFSLNHLLCAVQFNVVNLYDVTQQNTVSDFQLSGLTNSQQAMIGRGGTVTYIEGYTQTPIIYSSKTETIGYNQIFNAFKNVGGVDAEGYLLMWPHTTEQYKKLQVSFNLDGTSKNIDLYSSSTKLWEAGQKYTYNLYIKDDRINMQVTVRPWITDDVELE